MRSPPWSLQTAELVDKQACFVHPVAKMKDGHLIVWRKGLARSNIQWRAWKRVAVLRLNSWGPSCVGVQALDSKNWTFGLIIQTFLGFKSDVLFGYSLRKSSKKPLWSPPRSWRMWRRNSDMWSDTSRSVRSSPPRGALLLQPLPNTSLHTALGRGGGGGEREDFLPTHPLHRETEPRGDGAAPLPGEGGCHSGRGAAGQDPERGGGGQESWWRAGEAVWHGGPHPLPSGTQRINLKMSLSSSSSRIAQVQGAKVNVVTRSSSDSGCTTVAVQCLQLVVGFSSPI